MIGFEKVTEKSRKKLKNEKIRMRARQANILISTEVRGRDDWI